MSLDLFLAFIIKWPCVYFRAIKELHCSFHHKVSFTLKHLSTLTKTYQLLYEVFGKSHIAWGSMANFYLQKWNSNNIMKRNENMLFQKERKKERKEENENKTCIRSKNWTEFIDIQVPILEEKSNSPGSNFRQNKSWRPLVEGNLKAPFSIATTPRCLGERYSIPWIAPLYPWSLLYNAEC